MKEIKYIIYQNIKYRKKDFISLYEPYVSEQR